MNNKPTPGPYDPNQYPGIPKPGGDTKPGFSQNSFTKPKPPTLMSGNSLSKPFFGDRPGATRPQIPTPRGDMRPGFAAGGGTPTPPFYIPGNLNPSMLQMLQHRQAGGNLPPWLMNDPRWAMIRQRYMAQGMPQTDPYTPAPSRAQVPFGPPPPMEAKGEMWPDFSAGRSLTRPYISPQQVLAILMGMDQPSGDRMQPPPQY